MGTAEAVARVTVTSYQKYHFMYFVTVAHLSVHYCI